jgi:hypothetical protein
MRIACYLRPSQRYIQNSANDFESQVEDFICFEMQLIGTAQQVGGEIMPRSRSHKEFFGADHARNVQ